MTMKQAHWCCCVCLCVSHVLLTPLSEMYFWRLGRWMPFLCAFLFWFCAVWFFFFAMMREREEGGEGKWVEVNQMGKVESRRCSVNNQRDESLRRVVQ